MNNEQNIFEGNERKAFIKKSSKSKRKRQKQINVRLSDEEFKKLEEIKNAKGVDASAIFRSYILSQKLPNKHLKIMYGELRRQGGLLKKIAMDNPSQDKKFLYEYAKEIFKIASEVLVYIGNDKN